MTRKIETGPNSHEVENSQLTPDQRYELHKQQLDAEISAELDGLEIDPDSISARIEEIGTPTKPGIFSRKADIEQYRRLNSELQSLTTQALKIEEIRSPLTLLERMEAKWNDYLNLDLGHPETQKARSEFEEAKAQALSHPKNHSLASLFDDADEVLSVESKFKGKVITTVLHLLAESARYQAPVSIETMVQQAFSDQEIPPVSEVGSSDWGKMYYNRIAQVNGAVNNAAVSEGFFVVLTNKYNSPDKPSRIALDFPQNVLYQVDSKGNPILAGIESYAAEQLLVIANGMSQYRKKLESAGVITPSDEGGKYHIFDLPDLIRSSQENPKSTIQVREDRIAAISWLKYTLNLMEKDDKLSNDFCDHLERMSNSGVPLAISLLELNDLRRAKFKRKQFSTEEIVSGIDALLEIVTSNGDPDPATFSKL